MKDSSNRPPILTPKSLILTTKFVAIYAAFNIVTVLFKTYVDSLSDTSTIVTEYQIPIYVITGIHFILLLICLAMIMAKKYYWVITIACIVISLFTRFYFEEIASFINN